MNRYSVGYTKEELLIRLKQANDARDFGNQTAVGMKPGVRHEFSDRSAAELDKTIMEIKEALFLLDPDTYPNPNDRPFQTIPVFTR